MRLYWCVNCGYHGDLKMYRSGKVKCECCQYNELTEIDQEEYDKKITTQDGEYYAKIKTNDYQISSKASPDSPVRETTKQSSLARGEPDIFSGTKP